MQGRRWVLQATPTMEVMVWKLEEPKSKAPGCLPVSRVGLGETYELGGIMSFLLQKINAVERIGEDRDHSRALSIKIVQA